MLGKITASIFLSLLLIGGGLMIVGGMGIQSYTYSGQKNFDTLAEAQQFQTQIITAVQSANGSVNDVSISTDSPFQVQFTVYVHSLKFPYGQALNYTAITIAQIITIIVFIVIVVFVNYKIWERTD